MALDLASMVERVADYSLSHHDEPPFLGKDLESHDWEKGLLINGLLACDHRVEEARKHVIRSIETQTGAGQFAYGSLDPKNLDWNVPWQPETYTSIADPLIPGHGILDFYARTNDEYFLDAATRQYEFLQQIDRTDGGGIPQRREALELWVDALYMVCPFLARYGHEANEPEAFDDAVTQFRLQYDRLRDPNTGIYRHIWRQSPNSFKQSAFWSRGNGWVTTALVDTLKFLPNDHGGRPFLETMFQELCQAIIEYQDRTGFWHNVLDDQESWLETSGTVMFAYSFDRGIEMGILEEERFATSAVAAMRAAQGVVDEKGAVRRVAKVPGGPRAPPGVTLNGQGWFLIAASRFL